MIKFHVIQIIWKNGVKDRVDSKFYNEWLDRSSKKQYISKSISAI